MSAMRSHRRPIWNPSSRPNSLATLLMTSLLLCVYIGLLGASALAQRPRCRIESAAFTDGDLQAIATQVDLQGHLIRGADFVLDLGSGRTLPPTSRRPFRPKERKLYFVLLVEGSAAYAPATDAVRTGLKGFLQMLPYDSAGQLWRFGNTIDAPFGFKPLTHLHGLADRYSAVDEGELHMLAAVRQGLSVLSEVEDVSARRVLILLSDGLNPVMDRHLFRETGQEFARRGVTLFPIAFSPRDVRGPLRNLGELARHSAGTLRWARSAAEIEPQLRNLAQELLSAEVLTFSQRSVLNAEGGQANLRLKCGEGSSNTARIELPSRRRTGLWIGGGVLLIGIAALALWRLRRSRTIGPDSTMNAGPRLVGRSGGLAGQQVCMGDVLTIGVGLLGPGTWTLGRGPAEELCMLRKNAATIGYVIATQDGRARIFVNGRRILGTVALQDGDRIQIGEFGEVSFQMGISDSSKNDRLTI